MPIAGDVPARWTCRERADFEVFGTPTGIKQLWWKPYRTLGVGRGGAGEQQTYESQSPDPFLLLKGLDRIIRKPLEANRDLSFRISLARSTLQVDSTPTSTSVTSFALHLVAEFEQVVHQETSNASKKRAEPEKPKVLKLKKLEEEGKSPSKREDCKG